MNDQSGSKRKAPDSAVSSSSAAAAPIEPTTGGSGPPQKKQVAPPVTSSAAAVKAEAPSSDAATDVKPDAASSSPTKAAAATDERPADELLLEWVEYDDDCHEKILSISADEVIARGMSLGETSAAKENEKGEWEERSFDLKLVDRRGGSKNKELAELGFVWWADSAHAHLMNFNQKSGDLADFCFSLWCAAGRKRNQYSDMAIEFGNSPHSGVEVNELIAEACSSDDYDTPETTYLDVNRACATKEQGLRLLRGLIALIGQTSTLITHGSDLSKLQIGYDVRSRFGLETLRKGRGQSEWHVRTADYY